MDDIALLTSLAVTGAKEGCYAIQPAIWPEVGISTEVEPYLRLKGAAGVSLTQGGVNFAPGGRASSDTYFNLFNLGKWRSLCGDVPLELRMQGCGRFQLTVLVAAQDRSWRRIFDEEVNLDGGLRLPLNLSEAHYPRSVIFFELTAMTDGHLDNFAWATSAQPRQTPNLVLSVTTFRREEAVSRTITRFGSFRDSSDLRDHIRMIVVDNGNTLTISPPEGVTIVPNENLGGAGGFSRGMLDAKKAGASHCLFMDDDASIHMGAVVRTWWLLAYALDAGTAVAGAMINADHSWQIWENGAIFQLGCRPQFFGCDTRDPHQVFNMEYETTNPMPEGFYGGWWFFAFPIARVKHMPFPFFVRGDDVSFSLANDFRIVTLPGVASVQESFTNKASPLTWYLDLRSHLAHHLSLPQKEVGWRQTQRMLISFYLRTVLRFHYDSLSAVNLAIEDVMQGPQFFADNADMAQRRKDLKELTVSEVWQSIQHVPTVRRARSPRVLRALLLLTLNGHLLPLSNTLGTALVIEAQNRDNYREMYGARQITYLNAERTNAYTVRRDRRRFWHETLRLLRNSLKMCRAYRQMRQQWQQEYPNLTSSRFWRDKLDI